MPITNSSEQLRLKESLRKTHELCMRMRRVRSVFEAELAKKPETAHIPGWNDLLRTKVVGYKEAVVEGTFQYDLDLGQSAVGEYDFRVNAGSYERYWEMSTKLSDCRIEVSGKMTGVGRLVFTLVPEVEIMTMGPDELRKLETNIQEMELILGTIGLVAVEG